MIEKPNQLGSDWELHEWGLCPICFNPSMNGMLGCGLCVHAWRTWYEEDRRGRLGGWPTYVEHMRGDKPYFFVSEL